MGKAPRSDPDKVSTIIATVAAIALVGVIAFSLYRKYKPSGDKTQDDDTSLQEVEGKNDHTKIQELEDENAQLEQEKRDLEDKLSSKRHCVEDADTIDDARACF